MFSGELLPATMEFLLPSIILTLPVFHLKLVRSPTHASLFATASSTGSIGLWNLASSLEEPITGVDGIVVEADVASTGKRGLNRLKWSADGRRIMAAAGDHVHVLSLSEDVVRQKGDEDSRVMSHLVSRGLLERE